MRTYASLLLALGVILLSGETARGALHFKFEEDRYANYVYTHELSGDGTKLTFSTRSEKDIGDELKATLAGYTRLEELDFGKINELSPHPMNRSTVHINEIKTRHFTYVKDRFLKIFDLSGKRIASYSFYDQYQFQKMSTLKLIERSLLLKLPLRTLVSLQAQALQAYLTKKNRGKPLRGDAGKTLEPTQRDLA